MHEVSNQRSTNDQSGKDADSELDSLLANAMATKVKVIGPSHYGSA